MKRVIYPRVMKSKTGARIRWRERGSSDNYLTIEDIADIKAEGFDICIESNPTGIRSDMYDEERSLLQLIKNLEVLKKDIDHGFVRRVLLNGGLIEYTRKLESGRI